MGLTHSTNGTRRGWGSFFVSRASTEDFLLKWNAALDEAFLEKQGVDGLCIKTARMRSKKSGKNDAEAEFHLCGEAAMMLGSSEDELSTREDDIIEGSATSTEPLSTMDPTSYRKMQQEIESLKKEKQRHERTNKAELRGIYRLSRALCEMDAQSEALVTQCSAVLQDNNSQLRVALQLVSELSGVVKYLKRDAQKQADLIAELKVDKNVLNTRLEAALAEIYRQTGNPTFTMKERLLITPRHPYGSITLTSAEQGSN